MSLHDLLTLSPSSSVLSSHLRSLNPSLGTVEPEVKTYADAVYFNYYSLGLSLLFSPINGYKPKTGLTRSEIDDANLVLDSVDIYNTAAIQRPTKGTSSRPAELAFSPYPLHTIQIFIQPESHIDVLHSTSGKDLVQSLGEPDRKGGGAGPSSGSIAIWCEWSKHGIMVEFGGDEAKGPQAWERGKDAIWRVLTIFSPKMP